MSVKRIKDIISREISVELSEEIAKKHNITGKRQLYKLKREIENLAYINLDTALDTYKEELKNSVKPKVTKQIEKLLSSHREEKQREFSRFSSSVLIQHWIMAISVILLILTGMPIKFNNYAFSQVLMNLVGGLEVSKIIHRTGGVGLIFASLYHLFYIIFTKEGRYNFKELIPSLKDAMDVRDNMMYYFGKSEDKPKFKRFSYIEKFDYWAVYWGCVIMIGSGLALWFETFYINNLGLDIWQIAHIMHSDEALLATLAIVIWHFYNAHLNPHKFPVNRVIFTGKMTEEEMIDEHPLEYEDIMEKEGGSNNDER